VTSLTTAAEPWDEAAGYLGVAIGVLVTVILLLILIILGILYKNFQQAGSLRAEKGRDPKEVGVTLGRRGGGGVWGGHTVHSVQT
jgi:uncharacterized membrane protein YhiD involved in acid resistance